VEYFGFIVSILALLYLFFKQISGARQQHGQSAQSKNEEWDEGDDPLKEFMAVVERKRAADEIVLRPVPPSPPHKMHKQPKTTSLEEHRLTGSLEKRKLKSSLEARQQKIIDNRNEENAAILLQTEERPSRAKKAIQRLSSRRDMIIYQEIMNKPIGLR
jgi:hypothetical protein